MGRKWAEHTGDFVATSQSGEQRTFFIFTHFDEVHTATGVVKVALQKELRTEDGNAVNRIGKGRYQVLGDANEWASSDPEAP